MEKVNILERKNNAYFSFGVFSVKIEIKSSKISLWFLPFSRELYGVMVPTEFP